MEPAEKRKWTREEYLAMERASEVKHEYYAGEIFAMAGTSEAHNLVVGNLVSALNNALRKRPCRVYPSDLRVKIRAPEHYVYPDVTAVCGERDFEEGVEPETLLNPQVIFEVLSDSTESYDRGKKFEHYRTIPSLTEFVLVSQKERHIEHYARQPDGAWLLRERRAGERFSLAALGVDIEVDEIYIKVFEEG